MLPDPTQRKLPRIPPQGRPFRVVIDSDAKNEIDDQYAIALAILSPERFCIEGFVGANFDNERGGPDGIEKSVAEIEMILHEYRHTSPGFMSNKKGFFDLGDVAALLEPNLACWEETGCPEVNWDLTYHFRGTLGSILRCYHVDRARTFALLHEKLRQRYG